MNQEQRFFWNVAVPTAYPQIEAYHRDLLVHDRDAFISAAKDQTQALWRVGANGTHILLRTWVTAKEITRGYRTRGFITGGWKINFYHQTTGLYLVDFMSKRPTLTAVTWDEARQIYHAWFDAACQEVQQCA